MKKTVSIQIGNSDDKLSQSAWATFVATVSETVAALGGEVHFHGCSPGDKHWQNAAWIFTLPETKMDKLKFHLAVCANNFNQDAIAFTAGETIFVPRFREPWRK